MQWIAALSFAFGILVAGFGLTTWPQVFWGLVPTLILTLLRFWHKCTPWTPFVWNITLFGAIWMCMWQHFDAGPSQDDRYYTVEKRAPTQVALAAQEQLAHSGLKTSDLAILNAILLGDRQQLDNTQKMRFRNAGVQHLLALSGLHLGIILGLFSYLILPRIRHGRWRWAGLFAVLLLLWTYCFIVGMPSSLLRAAIMSTLFLVGQFSNRESPSGSTLAITLLLVLLLNPYNLFDVGTQLSFMAVGALVWLYPQLNDLIPIKVFPKNRRGSILRATWQLLCVSMAAWLGTAPLCLYYFHTFQPWQALVSLILVPMTTVLLYLAVPLLLLSVLGLWFLAEPLASIVSLWLRGENAVMDFATTLPYSTMSINNIHFGHVLLLYLILAMYSISLQTTPKVLLYALASILLTLLILFLV